ncbi:hypothetical protein [Aestuariispira ectoiniformans]|uniref:hypothetical protein n=1 Tax=Aestuariispira ectoiniformans TaxID=2775080 RepID=UPI00223B821E|nr:hypothetical protein [Aestuariispira ectoiniformans]
MMLEINIEKHCDFDSMKEVVSVATNIPNINVLSDYDYWELDDFRNCLGLEIAHGEGDFETLLTLHENPDCNRNVLALGESVAAQLNWKIAIPYSSAGFDAPSDKLLIFCPDGNKLEGFGENSDGKFVVNSISRSHID